MDAAEWPDSGSDAEDEPTPVGRTAHGSAAGPSLVTRAGPAGGGADATDWPDSESDKEAYGGPCTFRLDPVDPRSATYNPGVGSFLRSSVL